MYYAVKNGYKIGIFNSWKECEMQVKGFKHAQFKKFSTLNEAENFLKNETVKTYNIDYYVYTDGSCSNNGYNNATGGIGIYFGENNPRNISEKIDGKVSNNIAELTAIIRCFSIIENDLIEGKQITIVSDSEYAIRCATTYGEKCANLEWKKDIPNKELVKIIYETSRKYSNAHFLHIKAHTDNSDIHSIGNRHADLLATLINS